MAGFRAAKRYAKGLLDFSLETGNSEVIHREMKELKSAVQSNRELAQFLNSPVLDSKRKNLIAKEIFKDFSPTTQHFIQLVINQRREGNLKEIAQQYTALFNKLNKVHIAEVTSAVQLDDAMVQEIVQEAKTQMGADYTYEIDNKINPDLIGGFILRVGDKQVDSSIRSKLNRLKKEFDINDYVPKF